MEYFPDLDSKLPSNLRLSSPNKSYNSQYIVPRRKRRHTNFLYVYFLFSYYIGFVPFRFKYDCQQATFTIHSWYPQKIMCAIMNVSILLRYALEIIKVHHNLKRNNPIVYFDLVSKCSSLLYKVIAFQHFWKKQNLFLKIMKLLDKSPFPDYNPYNIQTYIFLSSLCSFYIIISVIRLFFDPEIVDSSINWYTGVVKESRYSYLIPSEKPSNQGDVSGVQNFMAVLTALNIQIRIIAGFYADLGVLFCVLSLWTPVMGYVNALNSSIETSKYAEFTGTKSAITAEKNRDDVTVKIDEITVFSQFKLLKCLSILLCEAIGGFLIPALSEVAFSYAIDFEEAVLSPDPTRKLTIFVFYASTASTLIFAAEICRKISGVKTWICVNENDLKISRNELMMILDNIAHDEICINAGGRITINYSFIGTLLIVLVTFFIIRLQSDLPPASF